MTTLSTSPKRGRPALDETDKSLTVTIRVTAKQYDALCQRALRDRVTLSACIRQSAVPGEKS